MKLKGKVAFVTGASRGIGKSIAIELAKAGLNVAVGFIEYNEGANDTCSCISKYNVKSIPCRIDLSLRKSIKSAINQIEESLGQIEILVNNAGIHIKNDFLKISDNEWDYIFAINLRGAFICCQLTIPKMLINNYGKVINISSIAGQRGGIYSIPYAATKAGLINLTRSLARLYSKYNIQTYCIAPGLVKTDISSSIDFEEELKKIPANRIASPDEVAKLVLFLCSEDANYLTGQTFNINGGEYFAI